MSEGTGDNDSKCLDRYSATVGTTTNTSINYGRGNNVVTVEGVGTFRPYRGQSIYFNEKYSKRDINLLLKKFLLVEKKIYE